MVKSYGVGGGGGGWWPPRLYCQLPRSAIAISISRSRSLTTRLFYDNIPKRLYFFYFHRPHLEY